MIRHTILLAAFALLGAPLAWAQNEGPRSGYRFTTVADVKTTSVKDQQSVGTCWDYATLSFLESELLRLGKPEHDLAEIFVAKNAYYEKGVRYVQFHGNNNFSEGGQAHDVIAMIRKYGIVPEEAYAGLNYGRDFHLHAELVAALKEGIEIDLDALVFVLDPFAALAAEFEPARSALAVLSGVG